MATVTHIATGTATVPGSTATTIDIVSPAGAADDLLVFFIVHDDYSDGPISTATGGVSLTEVSFGGGVTPWNIGDDVGGTIWWGKEDQTAGRTYTFGTLSNAEEIIGGCVRYRGQHLTTPIEAASIREEAQNGGFILPASAANYGSMMVSAHFNDNYWSGDFAVVPPALTERFNIEKSNYLHLLVGDLAATTHPFPVANLDLGSETATSPYQDGFQRAFTIAPAITAYTITGVTKDNAGSVLGSMVLSLFKSKGSGVFEYVATTTSNAGTGAYTFTVNNDNAANFMVYGIKEDSPHVFDATDFTLTPS